MEQDIVHLGVDTVVEQVDIDLERIGEVGIVLVAVEVNWVVGMGDTAVVAGIVLLFL